ncbi:MAG: CbiX/SirB N-terminal domain-containing protein [Dongiaceae bacterium]
MATTPDIFDDSFADMVDDTALVLCAHGIAGGPGAAADHARRLREAGQFRDVAAACLNGSPGLADTVDALSADRIVVVPYLMAAGRTFKAVLPDRLALARQRGKVRLAAPVGTHPAIADLAASRAEALLLEKGWDRAATLLVLVAHGTPRDLASAEAARAHARALAATGGFADVASAYLDEPPSVAGLLAGRAVRHAVGVGLFADAGPHGAGDAAAPFARDPDLAYAGPVGPDPRMTAIVRDRAIEALGG